MKKLLLLTALCFSLSGCDYTPNADEQASAQQKKSLAEAQAQVGMPAIVNFQEKRMAKMIYEMRDQGIGTHSYIVNEYRGCLVYLGPSIGYGLPYATQYSAPHKPYSYTNVGNYSHGDDQAEPNGLFMPSDAHGTWVLLKDPNSADVKPVYIEPDVIVFPFRRGDLECK